MHTFFESARPGHTVRIGTTDAELPILYRREDSFGGLFTANLDAVRAILPSDQLHPVETVRRGRAIVFVGAYNYLETSVGPYGEVAVAVLAVFGKRPPPLLPAMLESKWPGFGGLVVHLPVTRELARDVGRDVWGYPKFVADMEFRNTPELQECRLAEAGSHIATLTIMKRGLALSEHRPLITFSVKNQDLIRTTVAQSGLARNAIGAGGSTLVIGDSHPVADSLRSLDLDSKPLMTRCFTERYAILPEGEIIQRGVRALDGYRGVDGRSSSGERYATR